MYLRGVERGYSGFGVVEGECQVVAHPGFRIKVTEVELGHGSIFEGSRVEALAHRCEVWPVGVHWKQPLVEVGDSDEKVGDCAPQEPAKAPENGHQPEIQSPTKMDAEPCQMGLF
jgi:hypothetical protein